MKILNKYVSFTIIVCLMAIMDVLNFQIEYDSGFFSLTSGYFDMWHLSKFCILLLIAIQFVWSKTDTKKDNVLKLIALGGIALAGQLLIYNGLFKLL